MDVASIAKEARLLKRQQQRLVQLFHASNCWLGNRCKEPSCSQMTFLWNHVSSCKDDRCNVKSCVSSRYVLTHFRQCYTEKNQACKVCAPLRLQIRQHQNHGLQPSTDQLPAPPSPPMHGMAPPSDDVQQMDINANDLAPQQLRAMTCTQRTDCSSRDSMSKSGQPTQTPLQVLSLSPGSFSPGTSLSSSGANQHRHRLKHPQLQPPRHGHAAKRMCLADRRCPPREAELEALGEDEDAETFTSDIMWGGSISADVKTSQTEGRHTYYETLRQHQPQHQQASPFVDLRPYPGAATLLCRENMSALPLAHDLTSPISILA